MLRSKHLNFWLVLLLMLSLPGSLTMLAFLLSYGNGAPRHVLAMYSAYLMASIVIAAILEVKAYRREVRALKGVPYRRPRSLGTPC